MTWAEVAKEEEINASRFTVAHVVKNQLKIGRYTPRIKPTLDEFGRQKRVQFARQALQKLDEGALFVFTDESWINLGNAKRRKKELSRAVGSDAYDYKREKPKVEMSVMFWGAIVTGHPPGPFHIWEKESPEERTRMDIIVAEETQREQHRSQQAIQNAYIPGTPEHAELQRINEELAQKRTRNNRNWPKMTAERLFKPRRITRGDRSKGGIDWVRYRETILYPLLHPWLLKLRRENPTREIFLVEDNASAHNTAAENDAFSLQLTALYIFRGNWPPNSPDLNRIEPTWDDFKVFPPRPRITPPRHPGPAPPFQPTPPNTY